MAAPLTPLLLGHVHHDDAGSHYRHVDGHEGSVLAVSLAAMLAAVAWAVTLAVTLPASPQSRVSVPADRCTRWVAAAPALLFLATQAPASDSSCLLPLLLGTAIHAVLGAGAVALGLGCTATLSRRFAVPWLTSRMQANTRELALVVSAAGLSLLARAGLSCRAPPFLPVH